MEKYFIPVIAGLSIVFQATLNRSSAEQIGLVSAIFINAAVFMIIAGVYWFGVRMNLLPTTETLLAKELVHLQWWQFVPGVLGFFIVICTPMAIQFFGAANTFATIICTQLLVSTLWDSWQKKTMPSLHSVFALILILVGVFILLKPKISE